MVSANAAGANTAKGKFRMAHMQEGSIYGDSARASVLDDCLLEGAVIGKYIQAQGLGPCVNKSNCLRQGLKRKHRQNGAKDFLPHQWRVCLHPDDGGGNVFGGQVILAATDDLPTMALQQANQPVHLLGANNLAQIAVFFGVVAVKLFHPALGVLTCSSAHTPEEEKETITTRGDSGQCHEAI